MKLGNYTMDVHSPSDLEPDYQSVVYDDTKVPTGNTQARRMCLHSVKHQGLLVALTFGMLICFISIPVMICSIRSQRVLINQLLAVEESRSKPGSRVCEDAMLDKAKVTYQRWGRVTCPSTAELVYKGLMAGGVEGFSGGGANYLCLPDAPVYNYTVPGVQDYTAPIGATEYRLGYGEFKPMAHLHAADATCAVCLANRGAMFVMPGKSTCPPDWTLEYSGYLMGARSERTRTVFVCVDNDAVARHGTENYNTGSEILVAETRCVGGNNGGLPCPPYENGSELTCAVCTK